MLFLGGCSIQCICRSYLDDKGHQQHFRHDYMKGRHSTPLSSLKENELLSSLAQVSAFPFQTLLSFQSQGCNFPYERSDR